MSNFKHGQAVCGEETAEYIAWAAMKRRCYLKTCSDYSNYGGRGIKVCDKWRDDFERFYLDMGARPSVYHTLDRKNNDGDYTPENCRWATRQEQALNRRDKAPNKSSKTGIKGVNQERKSWRARAKSGKILIQLYSGPDFFEAVCARKSWEAFL